MKPQPPVTSAVPTPLPLIPSLPYSAPAMSPKRTSVRAAFIPGICLLALGIFGAILPARADSSAKSSVAESYIADLFRTTVETAVAPQSEAYATNAVKVLLLRAAPLDATARFMLGRALPTENKRAALKFQEEFEEFVAEAVTQGLRANPSVNLAVHGSRTRPDGTVLVLTTLSLPSGKTFPFDWQLTRDPTDGAFQITDVAVVGINAAIMLRTVTETLLADGDTAIDGLIPRLRAALLHRQSAGSDAASAPPPQ